MYSDPTTPPPADEPCGRTACRKPGAKHFNRNTGKHYCTGCMRLIERANPDCPNLFAPPLAA